jgi:hypothetical protein
MPTGVSLALALVAVLALTWLVLPGIRWGLPSETRNELTFGKDRSRWHAPQISETEMETPWIAYPNMLPGGPERTGVVSRSAFNPIRSYHPDEYVFLKSLSAMEPSKLKLFPGFFGWPALHFYILGAGLKAASWIGFVKLIPDVDFYFQNPEEMARLYLTGRYLTLLFAAGCILVAWAAVRRLLGNEGAAAAALLLAATPLFTVNCRYVTGDVPMLFWLSLVLLFSAAILDGAGRRTYVLAGIALGLAAATRYQGALGAFMIAAAHLLRPQTGEKQWSRFIRDKEIWIAAGVSLLVFFLCNPYIFAHLAQFLRELTSEAAGGSGERSRLFVGALLQPAVGLGIMLSVAAAAALCMAFIRRDRTAVFLLLALGLPGLLLMLGQPTMVRYMMSSLLFPVTLTAWAFAKLHRRGTEIGKTFSRAAAPALMACLLLFTFWQSAAFGRLYSDPACDTRTRAGEYIAQNIRAGSTIGVISEPWQFELPPIDSSRYRIVVGRPDLGPNGLAAKAPDFIVASDIQAPPLAARTPLPGEADFWGAFWNGEKPFHIIRRFEAWPFGLKDFVQSGPQDMRYADPVIAIARCGRWEGTPKDQP